MKIKFIKQVDHIEPGTIREFEPKLCEELIADGWAVAVEEMKAAKEDKTVKRSTKELKKFI